MANVTVKDLGGYNQKIKLTNGHIIIFIGQYATVVDTDAALLIRSNEFIITTAPTKTTAITSVTTTTQTTEIAKATTLVASNKTTGVGGLSVGSQAIQTTETAKANAAFASNKEAAGAQS